MTAKAAPKPAGPLQGPDRVAAVLMAMGKPAAAKLMKHFQPEEIKVITRSVAGLKPVPPQQIEAVIEEFAAQFAAGGSLVGAASEVEKLLEGVLPPEQVAAIMAELQGKTNSSIWERVSAANESMIAAYIQQEHPQTAALILSKLKSGAAAKVIGHLPVEIRNRLMRRMIMIKPVSDGALQMVERVMQEDFLDVFLKRSGNDTLSRMAEIINKMEREQMEAVLANIAETDPKTAETLRSLLFTFDDIVKLTPKARSSLFDRAPTDKVVIALKGTEAEFREVILSSLSARVRKMIEQELSSGEAAPKREVSDARRIITDLALDMAGKGEIVLGSDTDDEDSVS